MPSIERRPVPPSVAERYHVLLEVGRTLSATLGSTDLYRALYRETARVLEATGFYVVLHEAERDLARVVFYADRDVEASACVTHRASSCPVLRTGRAVLTRDRLDVSSMMVLGDEGSGLTRSAVTAPMRRQGRVLGAISAQSYTPDAYDHQDLELLQGIADIAGVAVENALYVEEVERRRREAEEIEEIGRAIASSLDSREVFRKVVDAALRALDCEGATVWLIQEGLATVVDSVGSRPVPEDLAWDISGDIHRRLVQNRQPLIIEEVRRSELVPEGLREALQGGSALAVPLTVEDEVLGALSVGGGSHREFSGEDIRVLQRIASQASVALENARLHSRLEALTLTDPLTGVPNRRHLEIHMEREVAAAHRGRRLALVIFDLDGFKAVNDTRGHLAGDEVLKAFGRILSDEIRAMNLVARYGGDEFVAVLADSDPEAARAYVDRVRARTAADPVMTHHDVGFTAGTAVFDRDAMGGGPDLLRAADQDLYARKGKEKRR